MLHYCNLHLLPTRRPLHFPGVTLTSKRELPTGQTAWVGSLQVRIPRTARVKIPPLANPFSRDREPYELFFEGRSMASTGVFEPSYILGRPTSHSTSETLDLHRLKTKHMLSSARPAAL